MRFACRYACLLLATSALASLGAGAPPHPTTQPPERVIVEKPVTVRLTRLDDRPGRGTIGELTEYDDAGVTLSVRGERVEFRWVDLTPHSAFTARYRLIDQTSATDWVELAEFAWKLGAEEEAKRAMRAAVRLEPSLQREVDRIRAAPPGEIRGPFQNGDNEKPEEGQAEDGVFGGGEGREILASASGSGLDLAPQFEAVSPEQAAAAVRAADEEAAQALRKLSIKARRLETDHFIIYTDWDAVDDAFLTGALEEAYRLVAGEFGISTYANIFVGKLPVYMFEEHETFMRYAREQDGHRQFQHTVAGYYTGRSDGMGKLVMSKPRQTELYGLETARQMWRRNLTHEFSHAFMARYRSNAFVPRWLNEGLAEVISEKVHPRPGALATARRIARGERSIQSVFDDGEISGPEMYPVMMTLVQALAEEDPQRFRQLVDRIKAGENAQKLLRELYNVDYPGLEAAWRRLMTRS